MKFKTYITMGIQIIEDAATWKRRKDKEKNKKYWKAFFAFLALFCLFAAFKWHDGWFIGFLVFGFASK